MRRLILFRHAKAERPEGYDDDHDRPLTEDGKAAALGMGEWMDGQGIAPDLVLCSTSVRTRETWAMAARAFDPLPPVIYEELIYEALPETLLQVVNSVDSDVQTLLLVGHNPGIEALTDRKSVV